MRYYIDPLILSRIQDTRHSIESIDNIKACQSLPAPGIFTSSFTSRNIFGYWIVRVPAPSKSLNSVDNLL